ncbi:amidase [Ruegeria pomeroyi]|uniref:Amidase n=1 Tax=Ruegeria pomeroyi TaxID=89184 RepID=A0A9Q3WID7_9RHOB|nr:amidase [Ruegeria pomeroyi]MCE8536484.1 amidase [Ruegeria pomeroyi]
MDVIRSSASDILGALRSGQLSSEAVMEATLARITAVNPELNAIVALRSAEELMAEARAADAVAPEARGPLHGLPIAIKDLESIAGVPTTMGSPLFADFVPDKDSLLPSRLRAAGAILIGKTNVPEFGIGSHTFNPVYGATGNPYAPALSCGGSSGGAAAALATGMTALADGSDEMGSLRNPAAWNNVYGFRPTWGTVPLDPERELFLHQLATLGPMGRSPADIGIMLDVIAGADARVPLSVNAPKASPVSPLDLKGVRIGWLGDWGGAYAMESGILELCESGLRVLETLGAAVEPVPAPMDAAAIWEAWLDLRSWGKAGSLEPLLRQNRSALKDTAIWEIERGLGLSAMDVHRASVKRSNWYKRSVELFDEFDALVLPSAQVWPFDVNVPYPKEIAGRAMDTYHRWMEVTIPIGLIGLPSLAVPAGFGPQGVPMGFQIFGPRGGDAALLALGEAYHQATTWPQRHPAM